MDKNTTIEILEALASGYSPKTGEMFPDESVLNEREVIRALQIAIDELKKDLVIKVAQKNRKKINIKRLIISKQKNLTI